MFQFKFKPLDRLIDSVNQEFELFQSAQLRDPVENHRLKVRCTPPEAHVVKINWHAATCCNNQSEGIGIVARDHMGAILGSLSLPLGVPPFHHLVAEFRALWRAMKLCSELGFEE